MSRGGELRPGSISAAKFVGNSGTDRGGKKVARLPVEITTRKRNKYSRESTPQINPASNDADWLKVQKIKIEELDRITSLHVIRMLLGILAGVVFSGIAILGLFAWLEVRADALGYFLTSVLTLLSSAISAAVGYLFGKGRKM
jgi:hypothetical protein